jgi:hypothetical protein
MERLEALERLATLRAALAHWAMTGYATWLEHYTILGIPHDRAQRLALTETGLTVPGGSAVLAAYQEVARLHERECAGHHRGITGRQPSAPLTAAQITQEIARRSLVLPGPGLATIPDIRGAVLSGDCWHTACKRAQAHRRGSRRVSEKLAKRPDSQVGGIPLSLTC